MAKKEEKCVLQ
uniref:Uncharacterized protein n=2 Tax=Teleostei TaxID=32443 RepID=A0A0E9VCB8_ANGAN